MKNKTLLTIGISTALFSFASATLAQSYYEAPMTAWGVPNFQGFWKHDTVIQFERPRKL